MLRYKNPAFCKEKETRILYVKESKFEDTLYQHKVFLRDIVSFDSECSYRLCVNTKVTKYYKFDFEPDCITDIIIGSKYELSSGDIKELVSHYWKVTKSKEYSTVHGLLSCIQRVQSCINSFESNS